MDNANGRWKFLNFLLSKLVLLSMSHFFSRTRLHLFNFFTWSCTSSSGQRLNKHENNDYWSLLKLRHTKHTWSGEVIYGQESWTDPKFIVINIQDPIVNWNQQYKGKTKVNLNNQTIISFHSKVAGGKSVCSWQNQRIIKAKYERLSTN